MECEAHSFNVKVAADYGMPCATIFHHVAYWVEVNSVEGANFHDGKYWVYHTHKGFLELFPYMGIKQLRLSLKKLVESGLLETGRYNQLPFDQTLWYTIGEAGMKYFRFTRGALVDSEYMHMCKTDVSKKDSSQVSQTDTSDVSKRDRPIPVNNSKDKSKDKEKKLKEKDGEDESLKVGFGDLENVFLTADEYAKLLVKMGDVGREKYINAVSLYKGKSGREYKSDYAACLAFWQKDGRPVEHSPKIVHIPIEQPDLSTPEKILEAIYR